MTKAWLLPAVVDPVETVCVQIQVPKDDAHIQAFFGALQALGMWWNWERDDSKTALDTSIVWQRQIELAGQAIRDEENCMVDCTDIEDCLETSQTIIDINVDIDINETNITNNETNINTNITNITNNETNIDIIFEGGIDINVYPPNPTQSEPDALCGASFYIANQLNTLIQEVIIDALTLTLTEILEGLLGIGGFQSSWVKLWYDFIVAVGNPDLDDEVLATIDNVAEHLYCAELDVALTETAIDGDTGITDDAQAAWIGALKSITEARLALWAITGSFDDTNDCSSFACVCASNIRFYPGDADVTILHGTDETTHWKSAVQSTTVARLELRLNWVDCTVDRVNMRVKAVHTAGGDTEDRNAQHYLNGGLLSFSPYDKLVDGVYRESGEDITPFSGPSLDWKIVVGWSLPNTWHLEVEWIELEVT